MSYNKFPTDLIESIRSGDLVPLIGAGLSISCGGKSWDQILQKLIEELNISFGYEDLLAEVLLGLRGNPSVNPALHDQTTQMFQRILDPLMVAQTYENKFDRRRLITVLKEMCDGISGPSQIHDLLASLNCKTFITTNYDDLIEQALKKIGISCRTIVKEEDVPYWKSGDTQVIKIHGSLVNPTDVDSIIFSRADFEAFSIKYPSKDMLIQFLMSTSTLLLFGYSARDPNFLAVHDRVRYMFKRHKRLAYLVTFDMPDSLQDYWKEYGLYPINLDGSNKTASLENWLTTLKTLV